MFFKQIIIKEEKRNKREQINIKEELSILEELEEIGISNVLKYVEFKKTDKFEIEEIKPKLDKTKLYSKTPSEFLVLYKEKHITLKELIEYCRDLALGKIYPYILDFIMAKNYENRLNEKDMLSIIKEVGEYSVKYIPDSLYKYGKSYEEIVNNMMGKHFKNNKKYNDYKDKRVFS